jgi:hypothetical protein
MTQQENTNAMADIMGKLNNVQAGIPNKKSAAGSDDVGAMADVLRKLQDISGTVAQGVVSESKTNPELNAAVNTQRTATGVTISRYDIRTQKKTVQEGLQKTFYYIVDNSTGDVIYDDLGLFESAMGIVKHKLYTENGSSVQRILDLDQEYVGIMMETYGYKRRLKRIDESSVQFDVTSAKYSNSKTKLSLTKTKLLKAL